MAVLVVLGVEQSLKLADGSLEGEPSLVLGLLDGSGGNSVDDQPRLDRLDSLGVGGKGRDDLVLGVVVTVL